MNWALTSQHVTTLILHISAETLKLLGKKKIVKLYSVRLGDSLVDVTAKVQATKGEVLDVITIKKSLCIQEHHQKSGRSITRRTKMAEE